MFLYFLIGDSADLFQVEAENNHEKKRHEDGEEPGSVQVITGQFVGSHVKVPVEVALQTLGGLLVVRLERVLLFARFHPPDLLEQIFVFQNVLQPL